MAGHAVSVHDGGNVRAMELNAAAGFAQENFHRQDETEPWVRLHQGRASFWIAENEEFDPIVIDLREQDLFIEGLGVGVIRKENMQ